MTTNGYGSARGASGSRAFTLNLVAGGVEAPFEGPVAYALPYDDAALPRARADNPDGFVVFRWTNEIIAVPLGDALPAGDGWKERRIPVTALTPMRRMIEAGGASSLAFASGHPERLRSLALMEPAWAGREGQTPQEAAVFERFRAIPELTADGIMPAFVRTQLGPGVEPPPAPAGPPPPWMPSRLAGIGGFLGAFDAFEPDFEVLRMFDRPVYFALGGRGNPDPYARMAERLHSVRPVDLKRFGLR